MSAATSTSTTPTGPAAGHDLPAGKIVAGLAVIALGTMAWFVAVKPPVRQHTLDVRAERRAACAAVPGPTANAIGAGLADLGGREVRSLRAMPSDDGWWMVSANLARPTVPSGFTGDLLTWRVRDDGRLRIESVDRNAKELSSFAAAPDGVNVGDPGAFDSRWCAKNAALSP